MAHISIRNWSEFQHYKDRSAPWVKLYRDLLTSESWVLGTDLSRVVQVASVLLAIRYDNEIPLVFALLRKVMALDCTEAQFLAAVEHLKRTDFLSVEGLTDDRKQDASNALAKCSSEESRGEERRAEKNTTAASRPTAPPEFESLWRAYPKRGGGNPAPRALKAARARIAEGATWDELADGVSRYAEFCRITGKIGTEYVMQGATFFGPDRRYAEPWTPPATKADVRLVGNLSAAEEFMRRTDSAA